MRLVPLLVLLLSACGDSTSDSCEECPDLSGICVGFDAGAGTRTIMVPIEDGGIQSCTDLCNHLGRPNPQLYLATCAELAPQNDMRVIECTWIAMC